ncbi:MAG: ribosomal RNA small subunit methyltransferase A [Proteobacteria bacterium]|nr:ribosomal RNA small subunit methyltransferase A [Pseudomonadota bacterium]MBU4295372.1 ribosomal RNA small subunit methyltransferase A [Pseudomonadota bacterium]MCG2749392.1 16S rRNA (adenine(1518)-N(6)/adenine(1519)-N(6))-dimethyltransferase RsmA [Desulfobulbaceae bacterium]
MSLQSIKDILKSEKLAPSKKRGQNFLIHRQTAATIVALAGVTADDTVVELGVGLGTLTGPLAEKVSHVIGLEIDSGIIDWQMTSGNLADNVTLIHQDLMKADFPSLAEQCGGRLKILANLPYSISNPLLFKLLDNRQVMEWAVLMLQKEVAMRLIAVPGTKEYGIISVLLAGAATVTQLLNVGPGQFHPRPKVDSVVVKITFHPAPDRAGLLPAHDAGLLRKVVRSAFQQRRKTLLNSLSASPFITFTKETCREALLAAKIDPTTRAERLTIEDFVALTQELAKVAQ